MIRIRLFLLLSLLVFTLIPGTAQVITHPFAQDVRHFKSLDSLHPPPANPVLFTGSSSFTLWTGMQQSFPGYPVLNRAFGGSTLADLIHYAGEVIFPYNPGHLVIYCGENDFAADGNLSPEELTARFITLFNLTRERLPRTRISYVSMKPSPSRWHLAARFSDANDRIREFLASQQDTDFINTWDAMLNDRHQPDSSLFLEDMLHMNNNGYEIWQQLIAPVLKK